MDKYIERKAIIEKLNEIGGCDATDDWGKGWDEAIDTAIKEIKKLPAADVAPARHGHWNTGYFHDRVCSCCLHPDNDLNDYAHSFCPNCGARMDKGSEKNVR